MGDVVNLQDDEGIVQKALAGAIEKARELGADRAIVILAHADDAVTVIQSHENTLVAYAGYLEVAKMAGLISHQGFDECS
jgi:hypothetical protein